MGWISGNRYLSKTEMENNATLVWNYLGSNGWTIEAVSAILGNMQTESTINPEIWENLTVNYKRGYGLVQWTPSTKYTSWGGGDYANGDRQCSRLVYEANNGLQWFGNPNAPTVDPPLTFKEFTQCTNISVATLANYFLWYYEHPGTTIQPDRGTQAEQWYTFLTGKQPIPPTPLPVVKKGMPVWMMCRKM